MSDTVRLPRFWLGLALSVVGAWWVGHDETLRYVIGLLFLTAGIALVASAVLRLPALRRAVIVAGLAIAVLAVGIVAPILRANAQTSSVWIADIGGTNRFLLPDAILVAPDDGSSVVVALDPRDGHVIKKIGTYADEGEAPKFTMTGDVVQTGGGPGTTTVDYYTYDEGRTWSREFPSSRLTQVDVIAADDGLAAVRTCRVGTRAGERECVVDGIDPRGVKIWTERLNPIPNHDRSEDRLIPQVLGIVPGSVNQFRRLDLRDGSVVEEGDESRGKRASELAVEYEPAFPGSVLGGGSTLVEVGDVTVSRRDETLTGHRDGREIWRTRVDGTYRATVANGGIAMISVNPAGWSPFLDWRTVSATKISMVRPNDGAIVETAVVPYAPLVYPLGERAALVTGHDDGSVGNDRSRIAGADEQRLIGHG